MFYREPLYRTPVPPFFFTLWCCWVITLPSYRGDWTHVGSWVSWKSFQNFYNVTWFDSRRNHIVCTTNPPLVCPTDAQRPRLTGYPEPPPGTTNGPESNEVPRLTTIKEAGSQTTGNHRSVRLACLSPARISFNIRGSDKGYTCFYPYIFSLKNKKKNFKRTFDFPKSVVKVQHSISILFEMSFGIMNFCCFLFPPIVNKKFPPLVK
jgi:hypothetical protein